MKLHLDSWEAEEKKENWTDWAIINLSQKDLKEIEKAMRKM